MSCQLYNSLKGKPYSPNLFFGVFQRERERERENTAWAAQFDTFFPFWMLLTHPLVPNAHVRSSEVRGCLGTGRSLGQRAGRVQRGRGAGH